MKMLWRRNGGQLLASLLKWCGRIFRTKKFERVAAFAGLGSLNSQEDIFNVLQGYYPPDTKFIVLPMDFSYMEAGLSKQPYLDQLGELRQLKRDPVIGPRIHPFVAIDPRREGFLKLAQDYVGRHDFAGIKLYPPMGFSPLDSRLDKLWEWAEAEEVPIMSHCSRGGVYFRGNLSDKSLPDRGWTIRKKSQSNAALTDQFSNPIAYRNVLNRYPNLKICLAHLGGKEECESWLSEPWPSHLSNSNWLTVILGLIHSFRNVFTDISYVGYDVHLHPLIHMLVRDEVIGRRVLFGSDFYMVQQDVTEREFSIRLRSVLSEDEFRRISETNPQQYLRKS